jgi:uncharacterized cupredoxin-like copper-binding protein
MKNRTVIAIVSLLALLLAACGGGGPAPVALTFEGSDMFQFSPSSATVTAGAEVTVTFNNAGVLEHNWLLIPNSVDPVQATEADSLPGANSGIVGAGGSQTFTFTAPAAGTYQFVCTVPGHAVGGMVGALTVNN